MTDYLRLPALATAHSHAFQRMLRGMAQRPGNSATEDFWSWRSAMYQAVDGLDPVSFERVTRVAYRELVRAGIRTVGEFHYVHHQRDGTPYDDRTLYSDLAIRVAKEEGLRITLLRTVYARAGAGRPAEGAQRRFVDPTVDVVLRDLDTLRARYAGDPDVRIGVAPHSTRAVPPEWLREIGAYATAHDLPVHAHVAEQEREIAECLAETGSRPLELFAEHGLLSPRFVAVHATNFAPHEATLLGRAGGFVCLCATTERDLGDGLPDVSALRAAQVRLCTGVDSHVITDPLEELRAIETHERLRLRSRVTARENPGDPTLAQRLWSEGSTVGALALGFADAGGELWLPKDAPELELVADDRLLDAVVFGGTARLLGAARLVPTPAD